MELGKNLKVIIFDFDGTLHDLKIDWQQARTVLGIKDSLEKIGEAIERLKEQGDLKPISSLDALEAQSLENDILQDEIKKTLHKLQERYKIAIYSRNSSSAITAFITKNGVQPDYVIGREEVKKLKPHPEGLQRILSHFNASPSQALLVGDTWHDLFVAHEVGIPCVIAGNNYKHPTEEPEYRIEKIADLVRLLT